jgi:hypothetical protein
MDMCSICAEGLDDGSRSIEDMPRHPDLAECIDCGQPACIMHGGNYRRGWEHETCHENATEGWTW